MKKLPTNYYKSLLVISILLNILVLVLLGVMFNKVNDISKTVYAPQEQVIATVVTEETISPTSTPIPTIEPTATPTLIPSPMPTPKPLGKRAIINQYVQEICLKYGMDKYLVMSVIQHESEYTPRAKTGDCLGLMQVSTKWHSTRAEKLGVTDWFDPYSNILLGVDYLSELFKQYEEPTLVLMLYNMNHKTAFKMHAEGKVSTYAKSVLEKAEEYRKGE